MRKPFQAKILRVQETIEDARDASQRIGNAAESQATLNIALTAVCVTALLVALLVAGELRREAAS
jgi:CHASE3 domain sensor protein